MKALCYVEWPKGIKVIFQQMLGEFVNLYVEQQHP